MDEKELLQIIEDAAKNEVTELDLNDKNLISLPPQIGQLTNLTRLHLSRNNLRSLPPEIGQLTNLKELYLSGDLLDFSLDSLISLPPEIGQLTSLTTLDVRNTNIISLPPEIGQLTNLAALELRNNKLTSLPSEIGQLTNLTTLDVRFNNLTSLPSEIGQLTNLTTLDVRNNKLTNFPSEIVKLTNLTHLDLSKSKLTSLPPEIGQLTNLTALYINKNKLTKLPPEIGQLNKLITLDLRGNLIETPPPEIVSKGTNAILQYFQQLKREGVDYLYEAKLLVVGEGGAGKTTFAYKVLDENYELPNEQPTTEGIDILQWQFPYINDRNFQVNIWDFGGQEIYHATHQFFLTKRSLYTLVVDNRKEHTNLYYWLNVVELLSDNSPLLIVQNERGDRSVEINLPELRGRFENLKETLATNLKTPGGMTKILHYIKHYLSTLPHIGDTVPKTWLKVREALEASYEDHISLTDYFELCAHNGITRNKDKLQLSGYLHDLGVCLHFQDDLLLNQTVILKPTWGTDAVYRVLDNKKVQKNFGRFSTNDLAQIWSDEKYTAKQAELLQLMIKFKLCYPLPNQPNWYIAPHLLTVVQPDYEWDLINNLLLQYTYEFMPKGIITRFIVTVHHQIEDQSKVWQSGVILSMDKTRAEVIEYYDQRKITIRISGQHKRDLMRDIIRELDEIHVSYSRLKYTRLVPCNCAKCKHNQQPEFYPFEVLRKFLTSQQKDIQCRESYQLVNVRGLLDDIGEQIDGVNSETLRRLNEILRLKQRRLQELEKQVALMGQNTPPEIKMEIEDLEKDIDDLKSQLDDLDDLD